MAPSPAAGVPRRRAGELKQATVLFADIVSSTEYIANLDPEEAMEHLQPAVVQMCEAVQRFGGTVLRTLGDGVMALFGVPRALEQHALLACEAAMCMQQAFGGGGKGLAIRVGLHSGLVASDPSSHDAMRGGGAHGLAIHVASRVVALADAGGVCITEECRSLLRGAGRTRSIGQRLLKGLPEPVEVHVLESIQPSRASDVQPLGVTAFCGRQLELDALQEALDRTRMGHAPVVGVRAAPGVGKSRLCQEFTDRCRAEGVTVFQVRVHPYGQATPLQPILEILRTFVFKIGRDDAPEVARHRIAARLEQWADARGGDLALLCELFGLTEFSGSGVQDSTLRRARIVEIFGGVLRGAGGSVSVLLLEDLHWLDESSEEIVARMAAALQGSRTLLLLNYRLRHAAAWEKLPQFRCIELHELSPVQTEDLVRTLMGPRAALSGVCQLIAKRSGGNPFFAEELVRSVMQGSAFARDGAANGPLYDFVDEALPETVQAVIAARIDRLKGEQKKLLQICAIIGKEVPLEILADVARAEVKDLSAALQDLCALEFLRMPEKALQPFSFGHPLIQEVAYATQLKATRSVIHALVGEAMEARFGDRPEYAALVGHHFEAAGLATAAARHIARAARWLSSTDSNAASRQWQRVRQLLLQRPRSGDVDRLRMMASSQIAMLGWRAGCSLAEVQPYIEEAKALAADLDGRLTQLLLIMEGRLLQASGASADEYVLRANEALRLAAPGDLGRRAMINACLSQAYGRAGLLKEALAANEAAWQHMAYIDEFDHEFVGFGVAHWIVAMRGRSLARAGRIDEAREAWGSLRSFREPIDPTVEAIAHLGNVEFAWCEADASLARDESERMAELASKRQVPYLRVLAQLCIGVTATIADQPAVAKPALVNALSLLRSSLVATEFEPEILAALAECELRSDDLEAARAHVTEAILLSRARGARIAECRALIVQALVFGCQGTGLHEGSLEAAERLVTETGALAYLPPLRRARSELGGSRALLRAS